MGSNKTLLLADKGMKQVTLDEPVNVMLTPRFYTLKKEALPLKYAYQAKRIAPSLFEGLLEAGKHYDYMVWKEEDQWVFLAYDLESIMAFLQSKGFGAGDVSRLFFAQQSVTLFENPLMLYGDEVLVAIEGVVVLVPKVALPADVTLTEFGAHFMPKKGIAIQGEYDSILPLKQAVVLAGAFVLFAVMFLVEGLRYDSSAAAKAQMQALFEEHPSLQSTYTRESIISKYQALDKVERKKRETVKTLSSMIFNGVSLVSLELDAKTFKVHFSCKDVAVANRIKQMASKAGMKTSAFEGSNDVKIEGVL